MNEFSVEIPVKPYVKAFLEKNCGNPVKLQNLQEFYREFLKMLRKPLFRFDKAEIGNYQCSVVISIPEDVFYRYGWELTKTDTVRFNNMIEDRVKFIMRQFVAINSSFMTKAMAIREFQREFGFSEDVWSYEAIKKDFDRHGDGAGTKVVKNFKEELKATFVEQLSKMGTITKDYKKDLIYE